MELNIHQKILSEIAALAADEGEEECDYAQDTISTKLQEAEVEADADGEVKADGDANGLEGAQQERVFMVRCWFGGKYSPLSNYVSCSRLLACTATLALESLPSTSRIAGLPPLLILYCPP